MKDKRFKAYFYLCISAFFFLLAYTLYYSFGFKYDPETGKSYQAGAIVVRTTPRDATVYKDGEAVENNGFLGGVFSPYLKIEDLEPKNYEISVEADGFNGWKKNVSIQPGQVAKYENIVLLKKGYEKLPVLPDIILPTEKVWQAPDKNELLLEGTIGTESGLFFADVRKETYDLALDSAQLGLIGDIQEVEWTEDEGRIILKTADNMYLVDLRDQYRVYLISTSVSQALRERPQDRVYLFDHYVIYGQGSTVYSFDYITKEIEQVTDGAGNFFVYQGALFYFKSDETAPSPILYSTNLSNPYYSVRISTMPEGCRTDKSFSLQRYGGKLIFLSEGALFLIDQTGTSKKINSNVKDARFFSKGDRILYYNDNEIWIYYVEDKETQPTESAGTNELLTRFSGNLSNIYVYADEEHLLFQENNMFKFTELDGRDNRNTYDLLDNVSGSAIFYLGDKDLVYFLGSDRKFYKYNLRTE